MQKKRLFRVLAIVAVMIVVGIAAVVIISRQLISSDAPVAGSGENAFPQFEGTNLLMDSMSVPDDLDGELRLIVVAFDRDQQTLMDEWLLSLEELQAAYPELRGYFTPLLPQSAADAALPIIAAVSAAASNDRDRARTIIVFTDVDAFNEILDIPGKDVLQLFLLDENGAILWRGSGNYDPATLESLENSIESRASE